MLISHVFLKSQSDEQMHQISKVARVRALLARSGATVSDDVIPKRSKWYRILFGE